MASQSIFVATNSRRSNRRGGSIPRKNNSKCKKILEEIDAEEVLNSPEAGEATIQNENAVRNKSSDIKFSLRFPNRGDVSIEESNKIAKILSSPEIQEELKKFKIRKRNSEDGYRFEELVDYEFDKEKYDYAFGIDSMRKGKKIVILFNVNGDKVPADIFFVDDDN